MIFQKVFNYYYSITLKNLFGGDVNDMDSLKIKKSKINLFENENIIDLIKGDKKNNDCK